ncbi:hypothetical protein Q6W56_000043 [Salmonella enterica]|uniref:YtcA family lipoprotein n=1 Tax=Salmonella enterica TaxID=28901 RepID=UPI0010105957|nr:YtcA family lipoprotein [Salmonella enterica]EDP9824854.1 hypothetical protein [Salmonella enterica subsp. enterica]EDS4736895.1 hypothetical protein [Salmonella enterica subsp. enterica serovar Oranienburg]EGX8050672.1 hypothetical protein [Salmonella enterica subsp. enterica serovar Inganda]EDF8717531.1 hypothetical protein [Salmonella enterica]EEH2566309.1 hypothetical protein [Salmonella enterica]
MQTSKSRFVMQPGKKIWLMPVILLTGCTLSPAIPVVGAYYPGWLFCIIAGVVLTMVTRRIILGRKIHPGLPAIVYTSLFVLYSMLFWLVFF